MEVYYTLTIWRRGSLQKIHRYGKISAVEIKTERTFGGDVKQHEFPCGGPHP